MALELHFHPFASYCMKVLIALYENDTPFEPHFVDLMNPAAREAFLKLSPLGRMPVLVERPSDRVVAESSVIIEYLGLHHPGPVALIPNDAEKAWNARRLDRFFDGTVMTPMQKIVTDRLRPPGKNDLHGVEEARNALRVAYTLAERELFGKTWAIGEPFTLADCAAAPALHYANQVVPFGSEHATMKSYFERLVRRPSFARVLREAEPYAHLFPKP